MLQYLKETQNRALTENGAATLKTTGSDCLDLFSVIGAMRRRTEAEITAYFVRAFTEDPDIATKLLFFARDIRGGLGERRAFRVILKWLAENEPDTVKKNLKYIAEYGRFDDLLTLIDTPCEQEALDMLKKQYKNDLDEMAKGKEISLLGKWLPSVNTSSKTAVKAAKKIIKAWGINDVQYRKSLSALRSYINIIENNLRTKDYTFDYEKQPSKAMYKYRDAFMRNDAERYNTFIRKAEKGEARLHADTLAPYELITPYFDRYNGGIIKMTPQEKKVLNATWSNLPAYDTDENMLAVIDTSGSMFYGTAAPCPAAVALSLGLYFAEHNTGMFGGHFIEFSSKPQLIEIKGDTFVDRLRYAASFNEIANTNLEAVFDLILDTAVKNNLPESELPAKLVLISDMEFDMCVINAEMTNFENAKKKFEEKGYRLPNIVFWNVASRHMQQPVKMNEQGVALVSGCTPRIFSMIAEGTLDPMKFMLEIVESERYAKIVA